MIYGAEGASVLNADIVYSVGANTYVCKLDPTRADRSASALPLEEQEIWSITFYEQLPQVGDVNQLNTKYPNGSNAYCFAAKNFACYNYLFRL